MVKRKFIFIKLFICFVYVVVDFLSQVIFIFLFLRNIHYQTPKQKKNKNPLRWKINYNIYKRDSLKQYKKLGKSVSSWWRFRWRRDILVKIYWFLLINFFSKFSPTQSQSSDEKVLTEKKKELNTKGWMCQCHQTTKCGNRKHFFQSWSRKWRGEDEKNRFQEFSSPEFYPITSSRITPSVTGENDSKQSDEFQARIYKKAYLRRT